MLNPADTLTTTLTTLKTRMENYFAGDEVINLTISDSESSDGAVTDTELDEPAPVVHEISDSSDTELEELAPAVHGSDEEEGGSAAITPRIRRRSSRRNSNGSSVGTLTRSRTKRARKLSDFLPPPVSCKLAVRRLEDHLGAP